MDLGLMVPMYAVSFNGRYSALVTVPMEGEHVGTIEVATFDEAGGRNRRRVPFELREIPRAEADSMIHARAESLGNQGGDYR